MSSPFGHSLTGFIIAAYTSKTLVFKNIRTVFFYVFIANAPDLDFIPGIIIGKPNYFHHGISHSLGVGVFFSIILLLIISFKENQLIKKFLIYLSIFVSHLFLDYISFDGRTPIGIPLFWPLSEKYYISPYSILPPVMHSGLDNATVGQFLNGFFSIHNLYVILLEFVIMLPAMMILVALDLYWNKKRKMGLRKKDFFIVKE